MTTVNVATYESLVEKFEIIQIILTEQYKINKVVIIGEYLLFVGVIILIFWCYKLSKRIERLEEDD